ncbi:hypothetical protein AB7M49_008156 [Bradyrhizobium elkanii]
MTPKMENAALAGGVSECDLATCKIISESKVSLRELQAAKLTRRCAISIAMAAIIVPHLYGEVAR